MTRDMWMDEIERIADKFCADELSLDEAITEMKRIGLDVYEAENLLKEAIA